MSTLNCERESLLGQVLHVQNPSSVFCQFGFYLDTLYYYYFTLLTNFFYFQSSYGSVVFLNFCLNPLDLSVSHKLRTLEFENNVNEMSIEELLNILMANISGAIF